MRLNNFSRAEKGPQKRRALALRGRKTDPHGSTYFNASRIVKSTTYQQRYAQTQIGNRPDA
jgi:hypothetical protein